MRQPRSRARAAVALGCAALAVAACFTLEEPPSGIASFSPIVPPSPSVVRGDTMRDSAGAAAPLRVFAFARSGDTIRGLTPRFTALGRGLEIVDDSFVVGDSIVDSVGVVADLGSPSSPIQTPPIGIPVTIAPEQIADPAGDTTRVPWVFNPTVADSLQWSDALLKVRLAGLGDTAAVGFVTDYTVTSPLAARGSVPSLFVTSSGTRTAVPRDTTDRSGTAQRSVALNLKQVPDAWLSAAVQAYFSATEVFMDSVIVDVTVRPRGYPLTGGETRTYVVVLQTRAK